MVKLFFVILSAFFLIVICACGKESSAVEIASEFSLSFKGWNVESWSDSLREIQIAPDGGLLDSVTLDSFEIPLGHSLYLAADADPYSPELGRELLPGTTVSIHGKTAFAIVLLDEKFRIVSIWRVLWENPESSSSAKEHPSSESQSSSSFEKSSSSATLATSSSAESSSSAKGFSSSSESGEAVSAGVEESSSSSLGIFLSDLKLLLGADTVENAISVVGKEVRVFLPYGENLSAVRLYPLDSAFDLRRFVEMDFLSEDTVLSAYRVIAGEILPPFSDTSFWATTAGAMEKEGSASVVGTTYKFSSTRNATWTEKSLVVRSEIVECAWTGITGGKKLATGIYFSGTYAGTDARSIYVRDYSGGTPSTDASDISLDMNFGKPYSSRPSAFSIRYSYAHEENENADYPQKGLVYAMLLGDKNEVVATGTLVVNANTSSADTVVAISYGSDGGLLTSGFAGTSGLVLGTGEEDVAAVRIVFASSAFAHVVAGGSSVLSHPEKNYRGAHNAALTIENFQMLYGDEK